MKQSNSSESKRSSDLLINKGVDLILNGVKKPKQLVNLNFTNKFRFFKRELSFQFKFSFNIKKKKV